MVEVHHYKVWNIHKGDWDIPPSKRTAKTISQLKGQIIPDTGEQISAAKLDSQGRYFPPGAAVQIDRPLPSDKKKRKPL